MSFPTIPPSGDRPHQSVSADVTSQRRRLVRRTIYCAAMSRFGSHQHRSVGEVATGLILTESAFVQRCARLMQILGGAR